MRAIIQEIIDIFNRDYPTASDETYEFFHDVLNVLRNSKSEWVSVKDRLPKPNTKVLVYIEKLPVTIKGQLETTLDSEPPKENEE